MAGGDWLSHREQDFADLCQHWKTGLSDASKVAAFDWKQTEVAAALGAVEAFLTARGIYRSDDSSKNLLKKNEAKEAAKKAMRDFANTSIRYNKAMPDEDKLVYGIRPPDKTNTPVTPPTSYPEAEADTAVIRQVGIHFWDSVSKKRGKPKGVHGAEIRWAALEHTPASVEELSHSSFDTASPTVLTFDESDRGKRLYFCLRWDSSTGQKGPYGEIYSAVIP